MTPPNKEDILSALKSAKINKEATKGIRWDEKLINIKVESLYPDDLFQFLHPSLQIFFQELRVSADVSLQLIEIWKNTYGRGGFQELHDHLELDGRVDISGCIFLDDYHPECGRFYFRNRHASELSPSWKKILTKSNTEYVVYIPHYKRGDIIFFPADMLHGVYAHKSGKTRQTVSFNIGMNL